MFRITACQCQKYTCASDFPTLPRFFVQTLNMIKHFIVFYCELKENYSQLGRNVENLRGNSNFCIGQERVV